LQKPVAPNLSGWQIRTQHPLRILILAVLSISLCAIEPVAAQSSPAPQKSSQTKKQKPSNPKQVRTTVNRPKSKKVAPDRPSFANAMGLRNQPDDLSLKSSVAMVIDQQTKEVLFEKNPDVSLPIASITKLMTAMVVLDSNAPLDEVLTITQAEVKIYAKSRLSLGTKLTREEALLLALMSSENRASQLLASNYPWPDMTMVINKRPQVFLNTNRLVRAGDMEIGLQKTGFISAAGRCLVMQAKVNGMPLLLVFLDSVGTQSRFADAVRVKDWIESYQPGEPKAIRRLTM